MIFAIRSRVLTATSPKWRQLSGLLSTMPLRIKLAEVPEVCTTNEWNQIIQQSRTALQAYAKVHGATNATNQPQPTAVENAVIRRLRCASMENEHLTNSFKYLVENKDDTTSLLRWPGLIVLMVSVAAGYPFSADNFVGRQLQDVVWSSQVVLAEIVNTLHCSLLFRKENSRASSSRQKHRKTSRQIDRLVSHYFAASSICKFAALRNSKAILLLSDVLETMSNLSSSSASDAIPITTRQLWEYETFHTQGFLLANGCQAALELSGHGDKMQEMAFNFGHLFTLAIKANAEIQQFQDYQSCKSSYLKLSGFPVVTHLEKHPETLKFLLEASERMDNLYIDQINSKLVSSSCLQEAKYCLEEYISKTTDILENLAQPQNSKMHKFLVKLANTLNCTKK